jgi:hypothetical protein
MENQSGEQRIENNNLYLYCFFRGGSYLSHQKGVDGVNQTFVVSYKEINALLSPVSSSEYNEVVLEQRIQDLEWLTPKVRYHEEIIRHAMEKSDVLPIRFGSIFTDVEKVLSILNTGYNEFSSYFDFINDKEEWGVKVYTEEIESEKIASTVEAIKQLDKQIASVKPGQAFLLKKKRENLIRMQTDDYLRRLSGELYDRMSSWAIKGCRNKVLSKQATGKDARMILNAAFLLNKKDVDIFKGNLNILALDCQSDGIFFQISGPWPCYNFCPEM